MKTADAFVFDADAERAQVIWGEGQQVLAISGEPTGLLGAEGLGKTTLLQQYALSRCGIGQPSLLGFPIAGADRPILYVAADRPKQQRRSLARMVRDRDRARLKESLLVWEGPLDFDLAAAPDRLADLAANIGAGEVILDGLGASAVDLAKDETGSRLYRAFASVAAAGVELVVAMHPRKAQAANRRPTALDDAYGSRWITAGMGSVLVLSGRPGDRTVKLQHLKQPAEVVGPLRITIDRGSGGVNARSEAELESLLRSAGELTAQTAAEELHGSSDRAEVERARRALDAMVKHGVATKDDRSSPHVYRWREPIS